MICIEAKYTNTEKELNKNINNEINLENTVVALGKFDGFHLGHKLLIDEINRYKNEYGYKTLICLIDINNNGIYSIDEKIEIVSNYDIDYFVKYQFTDEFSSLSPQEFIEQVLVGTLGAKAVVVGDDYCFGKKRSGNIQTLKELSVIYGYELSVINKLKIDDIVVSSTDIRQAMQAGEIEKVNTLLGREYVIKGVVKHGRHLGNTIGFPTINLIPEKSKILPRYGVYASKIVIDDEIFYGVTNIGDNPTIADDNATTVETYIFDFERDVYDKEVSVYLVNFIRNEQKFSGIGELKEQLDLDKQTALGMFE